MNSKTGMWMVVLLLGSFALPGVATKKGEEAPDPNLARWLSMSSTQQEEVRQRYESWKSLSVDDRKQVRANYQRFTRYAPDVRQTLIQSHHKHFERMQAKQLKLLRGRMRQMARLNQKKRHQAQAVGWFLHAADREGHMRDGRGVNPQRRRRMVRALRDIYREMPAADRHRLLDLPPHQRMALVDRILREKRGRFVKVFEEEYRDLHEEILQKLEPHARRLYAQAPVPLKLKLWKMASRKSPDERMSFVNEALRRYQRRMRERRRQHGSRDLDRERRRRRDSGERSK